ncbi:glycosyltransferase family protein [Seonamhaeicola aphaedonensis]|uniref:Glycosyltransferase involved in cell wall biosynthesis n=1 Tax=Seonamhaeicola aphaedonensis TaxID=1461338 RepID=A0A3D9HFX1_9FLAO|nr:hypothetical protein [Seonamhaeicola aphaedonensis]RED48364.1 hypothetical protein DFQ02_104210 [Seonamhaeicola aphaedonensis]
MKVFLPFQRNNNSFIDEIEYYFEGSFIYGDLYDYKADYQIVNIHWPEAIFRWQNPTDADLEELERCLKLWKAKSKIVYTCHNTLPHNTQLTNAEKLYYLVLKYADGFIHLGTYGKNQLINTFDFIKNKSHTIIPHPLYLKYKKEVKINKAKNYLGVNENAKVVLVFGKIRTKQERKLILGAFGKLNVKNKLLLVSRMPYFLDWVPSWRLKVLLKKIVRFYYSLFSKYKFFYDFVKKEDVALFFTAADVVFIPRFNHLNSGNVFLAFSYNKTVVGPKTGNITENLNNECHYLYDPSSITSASKALKKALCHRKTYNYLEVYTPNLPFNVSKSYSNFLLSQLNDSK